VAAGLPVLRATEAGVACGIHSSDRSSSHGCVVLAIVVSRGCGGGDGVDGMVGVRTRVVGGAMIAQTACWGVEDAQWREVQQTTRRRAGGFRCINIQGSGLTSNQGRGTWAPAALPGNRPLVAHSNATTARWRQIAPSTAMAWTCARPDLSLSRIIYTPVTQQENAADTRAPPAVRHRYLERHVFEQTNMHATVTPPPIPTRQQRLRRP
jgi:hypothetical protein